MFVRLIDDNGIFIEDAFVDELTDRTIETPCPEGFYLPKWNGKAWVEGKSQAEIDAIKTPVKTDEELADEALYDEISKATTVAGLKAALLGANGIAKVKGKKKE